MTEPQIAPDLPVKELQTLADALLTAAIAEKGTGYVIIAANGRGDYVVSFNVDRPSLKRILTAAVNEIVDIPDAPAQS